LRNVSAARKVEQCASRRNEAWRRPDLRQQPGSCVLVRPRGWAELPRRDALGDALRRGARRVRGCLL